MSQFRTPAMQGSVHTPLSGQLPAGSQQQVLSQSNVLILHVEALELSQWKELLDSFTDGSVASCAIHDFLTENRMVPIIHTVIKLQMATLCT